MEDKIRKLARLISEELDRDNWGDVDPYLFKLIADGEAGMPDLDEDLMRDSMWLHEVIERVVVRLGEES